MSRLGLQMRDAFSLSFTKFRIRRIRTALTLISASILTFLLVVASSVLTGFERAAQATPQRELVDLHLAYLESYSLNIPQAFDGVASPLTAPQASAEFRKTVKDQSTIREIYFERKATAPFGSARATIDVLGPTPDYSKIDPLTGDYPAEFYAFRDLAGRSSALLQPYVAEGMTLLPSSDGVLPVLVPTEAITTLRDSEFDRIKSPRAVQDKINEYKAAALGRTGRLQLTYDSAGFGYSVPPIPSEQGAAPEPIFINVKIVGFLPAPSLVSGGIGDTDFVVPLEAIDTNPVAAKYLDTIGAIYPSFTTTAARNAYVSDNFAASIYADPLEENRQFFSGFKKAYFIFVVFMLVLMAIPMAATMSKILSDSQRETGVFRAIGARSRHILAIYGIYTALMVLTSFLLALITGLMAGAVITYLFADDLELFLASLGGLVIDVSFVNVNLAQLGVVLAGSFAGALLGIAFPLWRALRRDPIKSLRDE